MRVVLLGDVGGAGGYHAGDEAMAEAVADALSTRLDQLTIVAVTGDAADTTERYGWETIPRVDFGGLPSDDERDERLSAVDRAARGDADALAWDDPAWDVVHAVAGADAVVISGGGNLTSVWPEHVYERAALAQIARAFGKPYVVTGQTFGPHLTGRHGQVVASIVTAAALVGAREEPSFRIAQQLGVPAETLARVIDDASYLDISTVTEPVPSEPYIAGTFAPSTGLASRDDFLQSIAECLDAVATATGLRTVLIPHHATRDGDHVTGDLLIHQEIAARVKNAQVDVLDPVTARRAAQLVAGARLVLSSRYHPVVFAAAAGVPAVGIGVDAYTSTKIHGALANFGAGALAVSVASVVRGDLPGFVTTVLEKEKAIRTHLEQVGSQRQSEHAAWWDAVSSALSNGTPPAVAFASVPEFADGALDPTATALREWSQVVSSAFEADRLANAEAQASVAALHERIEQLEHDRAELSAELDQAKDEIDSLQVGAEKAYALVSRSMSDAPSVDSAELDAVRAELEALQATRTFRYLRRPRALYRRLRQR